MESKGTHGPQRKRQTMRRTVDDDEGGGAGKCDVVMDIQEQRVGIIEVSRVAEQVSAVAVISIDSTNSRARDVKDH